MDNGLTPQQSQYLKERGFEIVEGEPGPEEPYPYLALRGYQGWSGDPAVVYHQGEQSSSALINPAHPLEAPTDKLVGTIEHLIAASMDEDGGLFSTSPGTVIRVFVTDKSWNDVAASLSMKYENTNKG